MNVVQDCNVDIREIYNELVSLRDRLQEYFDSVPDDQKYANAVLFKGTLGSLSDECRKTKRSIWALNECIKKFKDYWRKSLNS